MLELRNKRGIGDFPVTFRLCFEASPSAKPFVGKLVLSTWIKICVWIKLIFALGLKVTQKWATCLVYLCLSEVFFFTFSFSFLFIFRAGDSRTKTVAEIKRHITVSRVLHKQISRRAFAHFKLFTVLLHQNCSNERLTLAGSFYKVFDISVDIIPCYICQSALMGQLQLIQWNLP